MKKHHDTGNDGGPAHPIDERQHAELVDAGFEGVTPWSMGMSRRDYFAAAALAGGLEQGIEADVGSSNPHLKCWWHSPTKIAERAYAIADAMLVQAERFNRSPQ